MLYIDSMNKENEFKILLVDDDEMSLKSLDSFLSSEGYAVYSFIKASEAISSLKNNSYQIILTDYSMPEMSGLKLIQLLKQADPKIFTILYTGYSTKLFEQQVIIDSSVNYFIKKPLRIKELITIINNSIKLKNEEKR